MEINKWREYIENKDIEEIEKSIKTLQDTLVSMRKSVTDCWRAYDKLNEEKWRDEELQEMKEKMERVIQESHNGFPLTNEERANALEWQRKHDEKVHNNPEQYHGVSGGGFSYSFYPTSIMTFCDCICDSCRQRAIKEAGEKWYDRLKEIGGIYEVIDWRQV